MTPDIRKEIFLEIHSGNPREGPGDAESTRRAFALLRDLPIHPHILDIGCGPGVQTLELARLSPVATITALDSSQDFLNELDRRALRAGAAERIKTYQGSMFDLPFDAGSFDAIWSEGAIFIIGFEKGLVEWKRLLRTGGYFAATHLSWLTAEPRKEAKTFWREHYPSIASIEDNLQLARVAGYEIVGHFTLPESAWWDDYYTPLEKRLAVLREKYRGNGVALEGIEQTQQEIDIYRRCSDCYGYVFYILRKG